MLVWISASISVVRFRSTKAELESRVEAVRILYGSISDRANLVKISADAFGCTKQQARTYVRIVEERYGEDLMALRNIKRGQQAVHLYNSEPTKEMKEFARIKMTIKIQSKLWPPARIFKCTDCDNQAKDYHHPNYFFPFWVEPVCRKCHVRLHVIARQSKVRPRSVE